MSASLGGVRGCHCRWLVLALLALSLSLSAAESEADIRAAFLYNFAKFVTWPEATFARADSPLVIGIIGPYDFGQSLKVLEGKQIHGHPVLVRRLLDNQGLAGCHMLFIGQLNDEQNRVILQSLHGKAVLTVGDNARFLTLGGMIYLYRESDVMRFNVHHKLATDCGLTVSARLLAVAKVTTMDP